ncbi:hypothetical protein PFISCL1PPCAC_21992 [Pristionchus fissidentatus]|uniref:Ribosomal protein n=1 Tax=Pristionchus fissidentatus TaxID=1538716 RepID=A0AAV5WG98_9BILA|nr:hypothetical protein PFISCL1PPCAC_21992 [Pristionchus fissidentatus]
MSISTLGSNQILSESSRSCLCSRRISSCCFLSAFMKMGMSGAKSMRSGAGETPVSITVSAGTVCNRRWSVVNASDWGRSMRRAERTVQRGR